MKITGERREEGCQFCPREGQELQEDGQGLHWAGEEGDAGAQWGEWSAEEAGQAGWSSLGRHSQVHGICQSYTLNASL